MWAFWKSHGARVQKIARILPADYQTFTSNFDEEVEQTEFTADLTKVVCSKGAFCDGARY